MDRKKNSMFSKIAMDTHGMTRRSVCCCSICGGCCRCCLEGLLWWISFRSSRSKSKTLLFAVVDWWRVGVVVVVVVVVVFVVVAAMAKEQSGELRTAEITSNRITAMVIIVVLWKMSVGGGLPGNNADWDSFDSHDDFCVKILPKIIFYVCFFCGKMNIQFWNSRKSLSFQKPTYRTWKDVGKEGWTSVVGMPL